jgi:hypothetical protein
MAKRIIFNPDGTVEISAENNAEKELQFLLKDFGDIERRGHKHGAHSEEATKLEQHE